MLRQLFVFFLARLSSERSRYKVYARLLGVKFGSNIRMTGMPSFGSEPFLISIGNDVTITQGVTFHNHDGGVAVIRNKYPNIDIIKPIKIGNNVFIGSHSTILPGVTIGNNVIIAASSLISRDIPDNVVVGGVPAKVIKTISEYEEKAIKDAIVLKNRANYQERKKEILQFIKERGV